MPLPFLIKCSMCGSMNHINDDNMGDVRVYFHKGTPNTMDRMVISCDNCGRKEEHGIYWPLNIISGGK